MKYLLAPAYFIIGVLGSGCNRTQTCVVSLEKGPALPVFVGFTAQELDTILVKTFHSADSFTDILRIDTIVYDGLEVKNDTLYSGANPYTPVLFFPRNALEIQIPAALKTYRIGRAMYEARSRYIYKTEGSCRKAPLDVPPQTVEVNGVVTSTTERFFALRR